jgi:hypothetical protein
MTNDKGVGNEKEVLRVALDKNGASAYARMADRLKAENAHVRVYPSALVSFLVADYFATYFEKDLPLLVAQFFDSQSYYEAQLQRAKAEGDFERVMSEALMTINRIKSGTRRKASGRKKQNKPEAAD